MTSPARCRLRLLNRTGRPWLLVVLERRRPSDPGRVLGSVHAHPHAGSGPLDVIPEPGGKLYAALIDHVWYDSVMVSAVVTSPQRLPDREELLLEAVVADGALRLGLAAASPAPGEPIPPAG